MRQDLAGATAVNIQKGKAAKSQPVAQPPQDAGRPRGAGPDWGRVDFPLKRHDSPHGQVTAVSMMKDEGPFVIEWVAHHLAVGFTDLVVYTNDCSDGTDDMLMRLEELGLAHHRRNVIPEGLRPQPSALNHAQDEPVVRHSDWVMVFDADEFLSIKHGDGTLDGLLTAAKEQGANGVVATWRIFGSAGVVEWSRAPVTEQYLMAAPTDWNKGWGVKTLFTFDAEHWKLGIHRPKMKSKWIKTGFPDQVHWLNGSGQPMEDYFKFRGWRSIARTVGHDWVQLNHYAVKSVDSYAIRKLRGNVNFKKDKYNADYWSLQDRNEVRDDTMLRYSAVRAAVAAQLLADPVLNRLHHAAVARAEARLAEIKGTEAYRQLVADLGQASQVPLSQIVAKPPQPRDKAKIDALMSDIEKARLDKAKAARKAQGPGPVPPQLPMGAYLSGSPDLSAGREVEWVANHDILLPLETRVFSAPALAQIKGGKFERGVLRRMPQTLPKGGTVLEIGAGVGLLGLHLARVRPDLSLVLQEDSAALREVMARVMAKNGLALDARLTLAEALLGVDPAETLRHLARVHPPAALLIGDAALTPEVLEHLLPSLVPRPRQIYVLGRFLEAWYGQMDRIEACLAGLGLVPSFKFDPHVARGFAKPKSKG